LAAPRAAANFARDVSFANGPLQVMVCGAFGAAGWALTMVVETAKTVATGVKRSEGSMCRS
jgi:hypothetical protein